MASENSSSSREQFPAGLRVLLVDNDDACLFAMKEMLENCSYKVTACTGAKDASRLCENKSDFDLLLCEVHMPEMNGFDLLEVIVTKASIPVVLMSSDSEIDVVMKGIKHGACDYLLKPVRLEILQNIWQHAFRRKERFDTDTTSSTTNDESKVSVKKQRVKWSPELHQKFLDAVNKFGIQYAKPKGILELMNVPNLKRVHVASHLQKLRRWMVEKKSENGDISPIPLNIINPLNSPTLGQASNFEAESSSLQHSHLSQDQPLNTSQSVVTNFPVNGSYFEVQKKNHHHPLTVDTGNANLLTDLKNYFLIDQNSEVTMPRPPASYWTENRDGFIPIDLGYNYVGPCGMREMQQLRNMNSVGSMPNYYCPKPNSSSMLSVSPCDIGVTNNFHVPEIPNLGNNQGYGAVMNTISEQVVQNNISSVSQGNFNEFGDSTKENLFSSLK